MSYCANNVVTVLSNISTYVILYRFIIMKVRIVKEDLVHTSLVGHKGKYLFYNQLKSGQRSLTSLQLLETAG